MSIEWKCNYCCAVFWSEEEDLQDEINEHLYTHEDDMIEVRR